MEYFSKSSIHSFAKSSHRPALNSNGDSAESIPISETPLNINGKTDEVNFIPATLPQHETAPSFDIMESILDNISPPTVSTPPP